MLEGIVVLCILLWALGFFGGHALGGLIHILLLIAVVVIVIRIARGTPPLG